MATTRWTIQLDQQEVQELERIYGSQRAVKLHVLEHLEAIANDIEQYQRPIQERIDALVNRERTEPTAFPIHMYDETAELLEAHFTGYGAKTALVRIVVQVLIQPEIADLTMKLQQLLRRALSDSVVSAVVGHD